MKAIDWVERAKLAQGWESDYRAAQELGITRSAMSLIRSGKTRTLGEDASLNVAAALGVDAFIVLTDQAAESAKSDKARSAWRASLARLGKSGRPMAVAFVTASAVLSAALPSTSEAHTALNTGYSSSMCIM
jgi:hypothetical protein